MEISLGEKSKRVRWVDIAKGLLMVIVVISHMDEATNIDDTVAHVLNSFESIYNSFFMGAFFVITGLCTNFYKPWKEYMKGCFKSLIIPGFFLLLLARCICVYPLMVFHHNLIGIFDSIQGLVFDTLLYGAAAWFLAAMFVSRILCKALLQIVNNSAFQFLIVVSVGLFGLYVKNAGIACFDYWRLSYAMIFVPYLWGGHFMKRFDIDKYLGIYPAIISVGILCACLMYDSTIKMTLSVNCSFTQIPLLIIESLSGIYIVLSISYLLKENRFLEHIGKISLIVYLVQWSVMSTFISHSHLFGHNMALSILGYFSTVALVLLFATVIHKICVSSKYLKFVIGK